MKMDMIYIYPVLMAYIPFQITL